MVLDCRALILKKFWLRAALSACVCAGATAAAAVHAAPRQERGRRRKCMHAARVRAALSAVRTSCSSGLARKRNVTRNPEGSKRKITS
eukprot:6195516-Pleurochrysis_carterae.AAC.2